MLVDFHLDNQFNISNIVCKGGCSCVILVNFRVSLIVLTSAHIETLWVESNDVVKSPSLDLSIQIRLWMSQFRLQIGLLRLPSLVFKYPDLGLAHSSVSNSWSYLLLVMICTFNDLASVLTSAACLFYCWFWGYQDGFDMLSTRRQIDFFFDSIEVFIISNQEPDEMPNSTCSFMTSCMVRERLLGTAFRLWDLQKGINNLAQIKNQYAREVVFSPSSSSTSTFSSSCRFA